MAAPDPSARTHGFGPNDPGADGAGPDEHSGAEEPGLDRVHADASARDLRIEVVRRPAADSLEAAAALLGVSSGDVVKSLVVRRHDGQYLFALVPGNRRLSWSKLRSVVGVNRLRLPEADIALEATGYERGTITPLGSTTAWPVFADETIVGGRIAMGAGAHGYSLFVQADDFIASFGATVADLSDQL